MQKSSLGILSATLAAVIALAGSPAANAAITPFTSRTVFNSTIDGNPLLIKTVETWDGSPSGTTIPNGGLFNGVIYNTTQSSSIITNVFLPLSSPNALGGTDIGFFLASDTVTFTFPTPIVAFGVSMNTFATASGAYLITTDQGDMAKSGYDPFPGFSTGQFVGLISDANFNSVTVSAPGGFSYTLDDMTYASAVPEPGSLALLAGGVLPLLRRAARRRQS